jgi:putative copper export protein/methionine-rich copper-binding protein CopC
MRPHRSAVRLLSILLLAAGALAAATASASAYLHIRLESSSPDRNEVLSTTPSHLRLLFSGPIEARYTIVTLTAPDGARVAIGGVVFVDGSDREITTLLPALTDEGTYTVDWRTAGADGHVLEGSYAFVLADDSASASEGDRDPAGTIVGDEVADTAGVSSDPNAHAQHAEPESVGGAQDAIGRGLHFIALLLLLGAVGFRVLVLPRLAITEVTFAILQRRTWRLLSMAALLLGAAAMLRLWFQSTALHGAERAWNSQLLSIMLTDTGWGRSWLLQAFLFALLGMAIVWARPRRDRAAVFVAVPAVLGLSAIPGLSGHAAGATEIRALAVVNDALHVSAAGAWLGTLAVLMIVASPVIRQLETARDGAAADAVDRFSPVALIAGLLVLVSGGINAVMHLASPSQLWTTDYGRTLIVKLLFVGAVVVAGFVNWRFVRPRLRDSNGLRRLRLSASAELAFAACVVIVTAVLTGQPRP